MENKCQSTVHNVGGGFYCLRYIKGVIKGASICDDITVSSRPLFPNQYVLKRGVLVMVWLCCRTENKCLSSYIFYVNCSNLRLNIFGECFILIGAFGICFALVMYMTSPFVV